MSPWLVAARSGHLPGPPVILSNAFGVLSSDLPHSDQKLLGSLGHVFLPNPPWKLFSSFNVI